jgi:hypothetical protein
LKLLTKVVLIPIVRNYALVAQLDRVLGYEPSGRRFESFRARHTEKAHTGRYGLFLYALSKEIEGKTVRQTRMRLGRSCARMVIKDQRLLSVYPSERAI